MKINPFLVALFCLCLGGFESYAQREKIHLDLDKYTCHAGDTVWFKGYIMQSSRFSPVSTNLYVEVYRDNGVLISRKLFPVFRGVSFGQIIFADSVPTDNYYLVAFTKQQLNFDSTDFFSVPVIVYNKDKPNRNVFHKRRVLTSSVSTGGMVKGINWLTSPYKGKLAVSLSIDSGAAPRKLRLIKRAQGDTSLFADLELNRQAQQQWVLFPVDSSKKSETLLLFEDSMLIGRQNIRIKNLPEKAIVSPDTLDVSPDGYNSWEIKIPDSTVYYTSISVTDADRSIPSPLSIEHLRESRTDDLTMPVKLVDTSYLTFTGKATREFGKRIKDEFSKDLMIAGVKDTTFLFTKVVHIDSVGNFRLDSLYFFDNMDLQFQINKEEDGGTKDVKLLLTKYIPPAVDSSLFRDNWEDDTKPLSKEDTFYTKQELRVSELAKVKTLQTVTVKKWKSPREELDHIYTSGPFSEPALYIYDLRNYTSDYNRDIAWFLNSQAGRLRYDPVGDSMIDDLGHPIHYFVDEQEYEFWQLKMFDFDRLAYIKVLESDFLSTKEVTFSMQPVASNPNGLKMPKVPGTAVNVCIYTRKGKDFRTMRGGLNKIPVKGYSTIIPFTSDKVTLFWQPLGYGNSFRVRFNNDETTKKFRLKLEGMSASGKVIHYETIVE